MSLTLRDYQADVWQGTYEHLFDGEDSVLISAGCGFGKSVLIAFMANFFANQQRRVLVLTHRRELLEQNQEYMERSVTLNPRARKHEIFKTEPVIVSMAQTLIRRLDKFGDDYLGEIDYIIIDEAHLDYFEKIYRRVKHKARIGLTATPVIYRKEYKEVNGIEYVRTKTLKSQYNKLVQGVSEQTLIDRGLLVQDYNLQLTPPRLELLKSSATNPDGYTTDSLTEVFGSRASIGNVYKAYDEHGVGKKTLIFSPTTAVNKKTYEHFIKQGVNARLFDSVNSKASDREEVVSWFRDTEGAVLLNVGIFNVGFSVNELEVIIYNKKTKSLALYLQTCGRGSRPSKKIYKPHFKFIDLGLNIQEHGVWSEERNWKEYFEPNQWETRRKTDVLQIWECDACGAFNQRGTLLTEAGDIVCNECGEKKSHDKAVTKYISGNLVAVTKPPKPSAKSILAYCKAVGGNDTLAFKLLDKCIIDSFSYYGITNEQYQAKRKNFQERIRKVYVPQYFAIIRDKEIAKGKRRRLDTQVRKMLEKVDSLYGYDG